MKTKECKVLINNTENKKRGGRGETSEPSGINRHPKFVRVCAKSEILGNSYSASDIEEILQLVERPKAVLLRYFARGTSALKFRDWVYFIKEYYCLSTEVSAYYEAEKISEFYFGITRFTSFDSYRISWQKAFKAKKAKK
ncbi:MAG: hypothetical protein LT105_15040 [Lentimicrobium sp.]|nr:hypothetical protein [Lentimicrobium sp.]